jgi:roadblock/LC7 domain-containing protein
MKLTAKDFTTKVGLEWYPYNSWEFLGNSAVACIAMVVGYIAFDPAERRKAQHPLFDP